MVEREEPLSARAETELRELAYRDHLTGLPNRIAMADRIETALARSNATTTSTALLFVDIDGFKRVNDTLGHAAGDELLRLIGARLGSLGDPRVTAGRHGGDEFLLLVEDLPRDVSLVVAVLERVGARLAEMLRVPFTVARSTFEVSASAGASAFPSDAATHHELIEHADQAMYVAKRRDGAQLALFERAESHSPLEIETSLRARRGLAQGEFELFYQPVVEIADGRSLGGVEALIRWRDPDRGLLVPDAFLPFIEHTPVVEEIGEWVFVRSAANLRTGGRAGSRRGSASTSRRASCADRGLQSSSSGPPPATAPIYIGWPLRSPRPARSRSRRSFPR